MEEGGARLRLINYRSDGPWTAGVERDGRVVPVERLGLAGLGANPSVRALVAAGPEVLAAAADKARRWLAQGDGGLELAALELGPPIADPEKIVCVGHNYREHLAEIGRAESPAPSLFAKFRNSLVGPYDAIRLPRVSTQVDYEGELAVVVGRRCREVAECDALGVLAGYTVFNDVSARDLQRQTSQWTGGKALDTFAPVGPGIVLAEEIADPQSLQVVTRVNGEVRQQASTALMIFSVARIVAFVSSLMTLEPGDIIATGTPGGVGSRRQPPVFLRDGDVVEVEIAGVGALRNPVVA